MEMHMFQNAGLAVNNVGECELYTLHIMTRERRHYIWRVYCHTVKFPRLPRNRLPKNRFKAFFIDSISSLTMQLLKAAYAGDLKKVITLLKKKKSDALYVAADGDSAILCACRQGHHEILRRLLDAGCDVDKAQVAGGVYRTPLLMATFSGHLAAVNVLLTYKKKPDINRSQEFGSTPLYGVAQGGEVFYDGLGGRSNGGRAYCDIAELLIANGADIDKPTKNGCTPLVAASRFNHLDTVKLLLKHGARVDCAGEIGGTALHAASMKGHLDVVECLLAAGASTSIRTTRSSHEDEVGGHTPLWLATQFGWSEVVGALLSKGADIDMACDLSDKCVNFSPLCVASFKGHQHTCELLVSKGAAVDYPSPVMRPLVGAIQNGNLDLVKLFISKGAKVMGTGAKDNALLWARHVQSTPIEELLLAELDASVIFVVD